MVHAEMPVSDEPVEGLQLWVNLKRAEKMVEPAYQELKGSEIPKPSQGGVSAAVISGEALGAKVLTGKGLCKNLHLDDVCVSRPSFSLAV